ncbi:hypothetical protein SEA_KLEVEY_77 [Arthrobacter phage Klevey]|uniref:Uncharacterized protein n=1 Tax=Arthrobacter phage Klevey TaxID=2867481 RepID=A0AAE9BRL7_9CAUD|nr:hypothetical protein SEA_KLEVEY_77 [Arthrobacter phage Klevey]
MSRRITANALESRPTAYWQDAENILEFTQYGGVIRVFRAAPADTWHRRTAVAEFTTLEIQQAGYVLTAGKLRKAAAGWINDNILANR